MDFGHFMDEADRFADGTVQRILNIPKRVVLVAYLCVGKVKGYHPRPELEHPVGATGSHWAR